LHSLRSVFPGGALGNDRHPIKAEHGSAPAGRAQSASPYVLFGPPECGFAATGAARPVRGVGRALAGVSVHILDSHGGAVPVGAAGELHVGGRGLARAPAGDRVRDGERLWASGLLARLMADGTVELLGGRVGDPDLRGFRVDPARIENALAGCPGLREVKVALERDGEGEPVLVASAAEGTRADGAAPTLAEIRAYLWQRLPGYALPARLVLRAREAAASEGARPSPAPPPRPGAAPPATPKRAQPGAPELPEATVLSALWAAELGVDRLGSEANYWQVFSFLDALAAAREAGVAVSDEEVTRNRTLGTLATAMAVARRRGATGS
jgi:hypothetical protein